MAQDYESFFINLLFQVSSDSNEIPFQVSEQLRQKYSLAWESNA